MARISLGPFPVAQVRCAATDRGGSRDDPNNSPRSWAKTGNCRCIKSRALGKCPCPYALHCVRNFRSRTTSGVDHVFCPFPTSPFRTPVEHRINPFIGAAWAILSQLRRILRTASPIKLTVRAPVFRLISNARPLLKFIVVAHDSAGPAASQLFLDCWRWW